MGNSSSAVVAQQVFNSTLTALINKDYSIGADIVGYQSVLEHALSKAEFFYRYGRLYASK